MSKTVWATVGITVLVVGGFVSYRLLTQPAIQGGPGGDSATAEGQPGQNPQVLTPPGGSTDPQAVGGQPPAGGGDVSDGLPALVPGDPTTPQALIAYAEKLAPRMEEAEVDIGKAREFFHELEQCVQDGKQQSPTIQALCLSTAEELGDIHPELAEKYKALHAAAPPNVLKVIEDSDSMDH